jgi:hypothetical protein
MLAQRNSHTATTAIAATFLYLSAQCALDPSAIGIARAHPACDCLAKLTNPSFSSRGFSQRTKPPLSAEDFPAAMTPEGIIPFISYDYPILSQFFT